MIERIEELFKTIKDPKVLFLYYRTIEGYFKGKNKNYDISFKDFVKERRITLANIEEMSSVLTKIKKEPSDYNMEKSLLEDLGNMIINLIRDSNLYKKVSQANNPSDILNYENLFSFAEDIAILLVLKEVSKNQIYDLLSIFKSPSINLAVRKDMDLIKPLFAINLASINKLDKETLDFFYGLANIKTEEDYKLLKCFIESVYVFHSSYYGGKE